MLRIPQSLRRSRHARGTCLVAVLFALLFTFPFASPALASIAELEKRAELQNLSCDVHGNSDSCCEKWVRAVMKIAGEASDPQHALPITPRRVELWHVYEGQSYCKIRDIIQKRLERAQEDENQGRVAVTPAPK